MSIFKKDHIYKCTHNFVGDGWFGNCTFTKGKLYKASDDCTIKDDNNSFIEFPPIFDINNYFIENNEAV